MNNNRNTYQHTNNQAAGNPSIFDMPMIRLLLAGMYFLFGVKLTKTQRDWHREHAFRVRRAVSDAVLEIETRKENKSVLGDFTNDHGPSWRKRMKALALKQTKRVIPHERSEDVGPRLYRRWSLKVLSTPKSRLCNSALFGRDPRSADFGLVGDDMVRGPPLKPIDISNHSTRRGLLVRAFSAGSVSAFKHDLAADNGFHGAAAKPPFIKRGVLALR